MKIRILPLVFAGLLIFASCTTEKEQVSSMPSRFLAGFAEGLENTWYTSDAISVFNGQKNIKYSYLSKKSYDIAIFNGGEELPEASTSLCIGVYPYDENLRCIGLSIIHTQLPSSYVYDAEYPALGPFWATTSVSGDKYFVFKPLCGYLELQTVGSDILAKVTVRGNDGEVLSGGAKFGPEKALSLDGDGEKSLTLDLGSGLALGEKAVSLTIPVPPIEFSKGVTVEFVTIDGDEYTQSFDSPVTIQSGKSCTLEAGSMSHGTGTAFTRFGAVLDGHTFDAVDLAGPDITLCVPRGTDMKNFTAQFAHNGKKVTVGDVTQVSGRTANDFTKTVKYTITSVNGNTATYNVHLLDVDLPVIYVATQNHVGVTDKKTWRLGSKFVILDSKDWSYTDYGPTGIKGRGNTSWSYAKKPYAIKIETRPQKQDEPLEKVLGMPGHKRWCLLNNCMGYNFGNQVGYELGRRSTFEWSPHAVYVELVLNGVHKGMYSLVEQIRIDKERIPIKEMDANDIDEKKITGGYLLSYDTTMDEKYQFRSTYYNMPVMVKSPDDDEMVDAQFQYIKNYINEMEASLKDDARFKKREYLNYLDVDTFIGAWFTKELASKKCYTSATTDFITPRSVYYYKDRGGVLKAGPAWDFDVHLMAHSEKLYCNKCQYYGRLFEDKEFVRRVTELWPVFKDNLEGRGKYTEIYQFVDSLYNSCAYAAARDEKMWNSTWTKYPIYETSLQRDKVKQTLTDRIKYMDQEITKMKAKL